MNITYLSLIGLLSLLLISQFTSLGMGITNNFFYAPFHFGSGFLLGTLFLSLGAKPGVAIFLTFLVGIFWEIYEYLSWKFLIKKRKFKPQRVDTLADLILDVLGAYLATFLL